MKFNAAQSQALFYMALSTMYFTRSCEALELSVLSSKWEVHHIEGLGTSINLTLYVLYQKGVGHAIKKAVNCCSLDPVENDVVFLFLAHMGNIGGLVGCTPAGLYSGRDKELKVSTIDSLKELAGHLKGLKNHSQSTVSATLHHIHVHR